MNVRRFDKIGHNGIYLFTNVRVFDPTILQLTCPTFQVGGQLHHLFTQLFHFLLCELVRSVILDAKEDCVSLLLDLISHLCFMNIELLAFVCKDYFGKSLLHFIDTLFGQMPRFWII